MTIHVECDLGEVDVEGVVVPIIITHLYTRGGKVGWGVGEREGRMRGEREGRMRGIIEGKKKKKKKKGREREREREQERTYISLEK